MSCSIRRCHPARVVDTLAGANLRIFVRLNAVEARYRALRERVGSIEQRSRPHPVPAPDPRTTV